METAKYVLENQAGQRFDLTAPASIYLVSVEGLGAEGENRFAELGDGFFFQTDDSRPQNAITGDLIYQNGAYGNYKSLVDWIFAAKTLYFCYTPESVEYRRIVRPRYINKDRRDSAGWMRAAISFDPLTPWFLPSATEITITQRTNDLKAFLLDSGEYRYTYSDTLSYGGEAAGDMSAQLAPAGHDPSAIVLRYTGEIVNPVIRVVGVTTGTVYGICDLDYVFGENDILELCTQQYNSYVKKIDSDNVETDLLEYVNLAYDPFPRAPVSESCVLTLESDVAITGSADLTVYNYFRSV